MRKKRYMDERDEILKLVSEEALKPPEVGSDDIQPHISFFKEFYKEKLIAIIFYGSRLSDKTKKPDSSLDFFVVTDDGEIPAHSFLTRLLHKVVPPTSLSAAIGESGEKIFKYIHLDIEQLESACSPRMKDFFVAGRLSKRVKVVYYRDEANLKRVLGALADAVKSLVPMVCSILPGEFSFSQYLTASVGISYLSEWRFEISGKIEALISASPEYYEKLYGSILKTPAAQKCVEKTGEDGFENRVTKRQTARVKSLLRRSRIRGALRWPQYALTVKHAAQILIAKIERTHPEIKLKPIHKKRPYLFGIPYLLFLLCKGYIKTHDT